MNMAGKITIMAVVAGLMASTAIAAPDGAKGKRKSITRVELLEKAGARFDEADKDNDGVLDAEEARSAAKDRHGAKRDKMKEHSPDREAREGAKGERPQRPDRQFEPITRAAALEKAGGRFDTADVDGDGVLTPEERRSAMKARGEARKEKRAARS